MGTIIVAWFPEDTNQTNLQALWLIYKKIQKGHVSATTLQFLKIQEKVGVTTFPTSVWWFVSSHFPRSEGINCTVLSGKMCLFSFPLFLLLQGWKGSLCWPSYAACDLNSLGTPNLGREHFSIPFLKMGGVTFFRQLYFGGLHNHRSWSVIYVGMMWNAFQKSAPPSPTPPKKKMRIGSRSIAFYQLIADGYFHHHRFELPKTSRFVSRLRYNSWPSLFTGVTRQVWFNMSQQKLPFFGKWKMGLVWVTWYILGKKSRKG